LSNKELETKSAQRL